MALLALSVLVVVVKFDLAHFYLDLHVYSLAL